MAYVIKSRVNGKDYYVGNVGGAILAYGLVPPTDKRVLRFGNPSVCNLALEECRRRYSGGKYAMVEDDTGAKCAPMPVPPPAFAVWDRRLKREEPLFSCDTREQMYAWIIDGLRGTQGAERDHYVSCLLQLEDGKTQLFYDLDA